MSPDKDQATNSPLPRLCVCGAGNAGTAIAADCALSGIDVTLFELPQLTGNLQPILDRGGIAPQQLGIGGMDTERLLAYVIGGS
jgi:glycine/D-amino acid oxidase-like deaminating enzyme